MDRRSRPAPASRWCLTAMKIHLLAVGQKMPDWVVHGYEEYSRRMPREASLLLTELKAEKRVAGKTAQQFMAAESERILSSIPANCQLWVFDEHGTIPDTRQLADWCRNGLQSGQDLCLVIGGPDGLAPSIKQRAHRLISLSRLTLPHPLVRIVVAEQLYRAFSILQNHPYHRE